METIKEVLMSRDGMIEEEADDLIDEARDDLLSRIEGGHIPDDICQEWFGLEPDYIFDLM